MNLTTVAVAATAPTTAAAALRAFFPRTRFVDCQGAALKVFLVEHADGLARIFLRGHFDKCKTPRTTRRPVLHDVNCDHGARLGEVVLEVVFSCGER